MNLRRNLLLLFLCCTTGLLAQVPQKIAVMELEKKGSSAAADEWAFLSQSLSQQIEIGLDRTEQVLIIRKYLWREVLGSEAAVKKPEEAAEFAAKAGVEAVIFGSVEYGAKSASVKLITYDAVRGKIAVEKTLTLPYTEAVFKTAEDGLKGFAADVTAAFPPLSERESAAVRRKIKVIYQDISRPVHQLRFSAAPVFGMIQWRFPGMDGEINRHAYAPGISLSASYRLRLFDIEAFSDILFLRTYSSPPLTVGGRMGIWLFRDMIRLSAVPSFHTAKMGEDETEFLTLGFSLDMKPSDDFFFGLSLGPTPAGRISSPSFLTDGLEFSYKGSMSFGFRFEMRVWKDLFAELLIRRSSFREVWKNPDNNNDSRDISYDLDAASLCLVWKTSWGTR